MRHGVVGEHLLHVDTAGETHMNGAMTWYSVLLH